MFNSAKNFNSPITGLDTSIVTTVTGMFASALKFNQDISQLSFVSAVASSFMFANASAFNNGGQPITNWEFGELRTAYSMFIYASSFNQSINKLNLQRLNNTNSMFAYAIAFNNNNEKISDMYDNTAQGNISRDKNFVNTSNMDLMFTGATNFKQDISSIIMNNTTGKYLSLNYMLNGTDITLPIAQNIWDTIKNKIINVPHNNMFTVNIKNQLTGYQ